MKTARNFEASARLQREAQLLAHQLRQQALEAMWRGTGDWVAEGVQATQRGAQRLANSLQRHRGQRENTSP